MSSATIVGGAHSICTKASAVTRLRSSQAKKIFSVTVIVRYCQSKNATSRARAKNAKALGLKIAARSSEVGCNTPQRWHWTAPGCTSPAQCLQMSLVKKITVYQSRYATISSTSQISVRAGGLRMDARNNVPGLDTPQIGQPSHHGSLPRRSVCKAKARHSLSRVTLIAEKYLPAG